MNKLQVSEDQRDWRDFGSRNFVNQLENSDATLLKLDTVSKNISCMEFKKKNIYWNTLIEKK